MTSRAFCVAGRTVGEARRRGAPLQVTATDIAREHGVCRCKIADCPGDLLGMDELPAGHPDGQFIETLTGLPMVGKRFVQELSVLSPTRPKVIAARRPSCSGRMSICAIRAGGSG